jgi:SAM-dependent methyltransferase
MDVATGTGIWAIQFAEQNPGSYVIGTDLSKIQPDVPLPNIQFLKEDAEEEWAYPQVPKFDYIHLRFVVTCFKNPKRVLQHALDNLNPGGWIEYLDFYPKMQSIDGSHEGTTMQRFSDLFQTSLTAMGRDLTVPLQYKIWLQEAGLVDVVEKVFMLPRNPWPDDPKLKRIGQYMYANACQGLRGATTGPLLQRMGLSPAEVEELVVQVTRDSMDTRYKIYNSVYVVYGRKPFAKEEAGVNIASTQT